MPGDGKLVQWGSTAAIWESEKRMGVYGLGELRPKGRWLWVSSGHTCAAARLVDQSQRPCAYPSTSRESV